MWLLSVRGVNHLPVTGRVVTGEKAKCHRRMLYEMSVKHLESRVKIGCFMLVVFLIQIFS